MKHMLLHRIPTAVLALALLLTPYAAQGQDEGLADVRSLEYIPRDVLFVVHLESKVYSADLLAQVRTQFPLPDLPVIGLPAHTVDAITFAGLPGERDLGIVVKCKLDGAGVAELEKKIAAKEFSRSEICGRQVLKRPGGCLVRLAANSILFAESETTLKRSLLTSSAANTSWGSYWKSNNAPVAAIANTSLLRGSSLIQQMWRIDQRPVSLQSFAQLANTTNFVGLEIYTDQNIRLRVRTSSETEEEAALARGSLRASIGAGRLALSTIRAAIADLESSDLLANIDLIDQIMEQANIQTSGTQVAAQMTLTAEAQSKLRQGLKTSLSAASNARRRLTTMNRLKQTGLALHNYESAYRRFPAAVQEMKDGTQRSWRVTISPFMESAEVWNAYQQNEPWDSPANLKLLAKIPPALRADGQEPGMTDIFVLNGPGAVFDGGRHARFANISDGTSNTIFLVALPRAVPWTKPEDVPFDANGPLTFDIPDNGLIVGFADGSVHELPPNVDLDALKAAITAAGGEPPSLRQNIDIRGNRFR